jgi:hypothetical protein
MTKRQHPVTATPGPPAVSSLVLLVLTGSTVSHAAICRTAEFAAGAPVTVIGTAGTEPEQVRRAVAHAMSALEDTGVAALGHVAVTGSPGRAVARVARARGARVVVLDRGPTGPAHPAGPGAAGRQEGLAAELRRRMYGSGIIVVAPDDLGGARLRR